MNILPWYSQYTLSCPIYVTNNKHLFMPNQEIQNINTRSNPKFHISSTNLTKSKKGVYYSGIQHFSHLSSYIRSLSDDIKLFRETLKHFLHSNSWYSVEEYFDFQDEWKVNSVPIPLRLSLILTTEN
jgi:hypothetical protein